MNKAPFILAHKFICFYFRNPAGVDPKSAKRNVGTTVEFRESRLGGNVMSAV